MTYITIDGDDIGQKITSCYLRNDLRALTEINELVRNKTNEIAGLLISKGFTVIFCAADGVAACHNEEIENWNLIFDEILILTERKITFSAGVGASLRESYIALLSAKSSGKSCIHDFRHLKN